MIDKKKFLFLCEIRQWPPSTALIHTVTWKGYPHRVTLISCARIRGRLVHPLTAPPFASICSGHYFVRPTVASLLRISKKRDSPI